jgi:hypothetical protein
VQPKARHAQGQLDFLDIAKNALQNPTYPSKKSSGIQVNPALFSIIQKILSKIEVVAL